jgi:hypothetical protein
MLAAPVWWYRLSSPTPEGIGYSQFRARRGGVAVGIDASSGLALQFSDQSVFKCLQSCGASIGRTANFSRLRNRSSIAPIDEPQQQPTEMRIGQPAMNGMIAASRAATCFAQRTSRTISWTTSVQPLRAFSPALFRRRLVQITPAIVAWTS